MKSVSQNLSLNNEINKNQLDNKENENKEENKPEKINFINCIFFSKYKVVKKIADGNYSQIYQVINQDGEYFCCKIEPKNSSQLLLENESKIMNYLQGTKIPNIKVYGESGDFNILIMQILGKNLDYYIKKLEKFSIKTTAMLAYQMIDILQFIHERHIIHRDIKPGNFVMGLGKENLDLYMIDFGFAKKYRSNKTYKINPMTKGHKLTGTARFASINAMKGYEQSCRDDLESLGYLLFFFLRGNLPWQGLKEKTKEELNIRILDMKEKTKTEELGVNLPIQFSELLEHAKNLKYEEQPDYNLFKKKMKEVVCINGNESEFDKIYDWTNKQKVLNDKNRETDKVESKCCQM